VEVGGGGSTDNRKILQGVQHLFQLRNLSTRKLASVSAATSPGLGKMGERPIISARNQHSPSLRDYNRQRQELNLSGTHCLALPSLSLQEKQSEYASVSHAGGTVFESHRISFWVFPAFLSPSIKISRWYLTAG
jgi:hypothetical protein